MNQIKKAEALAKILGVEVGEEFRINVNPIVKYKICDDGVLRYKHDKNDKNDLFQTAEITANSLLVGEIIKLPWEPKIGETYYFPSFLSLYGYNLAEFDSDKELDLMIKNAVGIYRTKEDALAKAKELGWLIESEEK